MPWKEQSLEDVAKSLGVDIQEVREKHRLIDLIIKARKAKHMSQASLAKKLGVGQSRIAQIESGIGTGTITFDVLFRVLCTLGYDCKIVAKKAA